MQWQFTLIYSEGNHFCRGNGRTKKIFLYYFDHFISEITDGTQQPVTAPPIAPLRPVPPCKRAMAYIK